MKNLIELDVLLANLSDQQQRSSFAFLCLGITESLAGGAMNATEALQQFFHADNCLFVHKRFQEKLADELMSRGVQLADLFEVLPVEQAQQEFQRELNTMHSLCLQMLNEQRVAA